MQTFHSLSISISTVNSQHGREYWHWQHWIFPINEKHRYWLTPKNSCNSIQFHPIPFHSILYFVKLIFSFGWIVYFCSFNKFPNYLVRFIEFSVFETSNGFSFFSVFLFLFCANRNVCPLCKVDNVFNLHMRLVESILSVCRILFVLFVQLYRIVSYCIGELQQLKKSREKNRFIKRQEAYGGIG